MKPKFVFVYGTLKRGHYGDYMFKTSEYVGEAYTLDKFDMTHKDHGFPRTKKNEKGSHIVGQVFKVTEQSILDSLDTYEGYPSFYDRIVTPVKFKDGEIDAEMYLSSGSAEMFNYNDVKLCQPDEENKVRWG
jgi:gamma-glutamylcyclotransferase (GGCT)/AIG2-like uncharacterized protein YtfP